MISTLQKRYHYNKQEHQIQTLKLASKLCSDKDIDIRKGDKINYYTTVTSTYTHK